MKNEKSNFLQTWEKTKKDVQSWRGVVRTLKSVENVNLAKSAEFIFAKHEKEFKVYAKEKEGKKGLSVWFGFLFLCKKVKEYNGQDEYILNFQKEIKKADIEKRAKSQQTRENKK
jgi:hypothetical protein